MSVDNLYNFVAQKIYKICINFWNIWIWKVNNPCRESVVHLSNIRDMTREPSKVTRHFHEYSEFLCRRCSRMPGRNENRSRARHLRHCDVQYRGSDSTQRDIPSSYDRVPPLSRIFRERGGLTRFRALIGEWIWMEHALIRHFSTVVSRMLLTICVSWRLLVNNLLRARIRSRCLSFNHYQRFRIHCPYLPIDPKRIPLLSSLSSEWTSSPIGDDCNDSTLTLM